MDSIGLKVGDAAHKCSALADEAVSCGSQQFYYYSIRPLELDNYVHGRWMVRARFLSVRVGIYRKAERGGQNDSCGSMNSFLI